MVTDSITGETKIIDRSQNRTPTAAKTEEGKKASDDTQAAEKKAADDTKAAEKKAADAKAAEKKATDAKGAEKKAADAKAAEKKQAAAPKAHGEEDAKAKTPEEELRQMSDDDFLKVLQSVRFDYDIGSQRFRVHYKDRYIKHVSLTQQLCYVIGYPEAQKLRNGEVAKFPPDLRGGISSIVVYTDITQPVIMGDQMAQLLQIVNVTGEPGSNVEMIYEQPLFMRIVSKEIDSITIDLRTLDNRPVMFAYGLVILKIIFRKVFLF
ncbi:Protein Y57G11C.20 [Aphelenchoides avenae]|nr:Protein Y57G11C.20 [Aphelenchus avenae]